MLGNKEVQTTGYAEVTQRLFSRLMPGIIHEINNPLGVIRNNNEALKDYAEELLSFINVKRNLEQEEQLQEIKEDIPLIFKEVEISTTKIIDTIQGIHLLTAKSSHQYTEDLNKVIDKVINACWNEIKYNFVITKEYEDLEKIEIRDTDLGQIIMILLLDILDALQDTGVIKISTRQEEKFVFVDIEDDRKDHQRKKRSLLSEIAEKNTNESRYVVRIDKTSKKVIILTENKEKGSKTTIKVPVS